MYAIEHFKWLEDKILCNDGFILWSDSELELIKGALLYEKDETQFIFLIPNLKNKLASSVEWFGNVYESYKVLGLVSYPFKSNKQCGYIFTRYNYHKNNIIWNHIYMR